jgi:hypothetical protein
VQPEAHLDEQVGEIVELLGDYQARREAGPRTSRSLETGAWMLSLGVSPRERREYRLTVMINRTRPS